MTDQWMLRGVEYGNCNCAWGCPCQFSAPSTYGKCEAFVAGHIEEGHFNDTSLDGLDWAMILQWPGEIADGNGKQQIVIDERADEAQTREAEQSGEPETVGCQPHDHGRLGIDAVVLEALVPVSEAFA